MKRIFCIFLCGLLMLGVAACGETENPAESSEPGYVSSEVPEQSSEAADESSEMPKQDPINVLVLGNSFTYNNDLAGVLQSICDSAGVNVHVVGISIGSARLDWFVTASESVCKTLNAELEKNVFHYAILQEHSTRPYKDYASFRSGAEAVAEKIRKSSPECEMLLYETWGFHDDNESLKEQGMTSKDQELLLLDAYEKLAEEMGAEVGYAGVSFYRVYKETDYNPYANDLKHPSYAGTYTAAMTLFYTLFPDIDVEKITFCGKLEPETAEAIRVICREVVHAEEKKGMLNG